MGAWSQKSEARLQVHDPAARLAAGAILVRDRAAPARPELPPDPLEVVHLEDEEGDDPEDDFGLRHAAQRIGGTPKTAMGRAALIGPLGSYSKRLPLPAT